MKADDLLQRMIGVSEAMKKHSNRMLSEIGLTHGQAMILGFLMTNRNQKVTQKDIEKNFTLSHATVNGFMQRMEQKELLTIRQDDCDKRFNVIEPTEKLLELYQRMQQSLEGFLHLLDSQMSPQEQETLLYLLNKLDDIGKQSVELFIKEQQYEKKH